MVGIQNRRSALTSRPMLANAYTSLAVVMGGGAPSSSTSAMMISGAIQRVEPAKKDVPRVLPLSGRSRSSMTFERPKSVIVGTPASSMRTLPCAASAWCAGCDR